MKNKTLLCVIIFMGSFFYSFSQNLVPNYSFEDTTQCPNQFYDFGGYVSNWTGVEPGYFSPYCSDNPYGGMPLNSWGYQYPHTGHSYIGIYTFANPNKDTNLPSYKVLHNLRDYIQVQLTSMLINKTKYFVTFYVSLADSCNYACNNIGTYFSDSAILISNTRKVISYHTPQITNDAQHNLLLDTLNWIKISSSFVAQGGEQYITIGNFSTDAQNDTVNLGKRSVTVPASYYYIDDIIVSSDSNYADSLFLSIPNIHQPKDIVQVFPNPSSGLFTFQLQDNTQRTTIEIYNMLGENVYNSHFSATTTQIDLSGRPAGIYLYRVLTAEGEAVASGKIIIQ